MVLAVALSHHEGPLRAALMSEYGLRLHELRSYPAREAADLVAWLPAGSVLWQDIGGPASLSVEAHQLREVTYWLRVLDYRERQSKGEPPKRDPEPVWAHERRAQEETTQRKAAAYMRRQARSVR